MPTIQTQLRTKKYRIRLATHTNRSDSRQKYNLSELNKNYYEKARKAYQDSLKSPKPKYSDLDQHIKPQPGPQTLFLSSSADIAIYGGAAGGGKVQPLYSKVLTPFGWTTMGELKIGSKVCATDGTVTSIIGIYPQGIIDSYKVKFTDGTHTEVGLDHLWSAWRLHKSVKLGSNPTNGIKSSQIWTTREIIDQTAKGHRFAIPLTDPTAFNVAGQLHGRGNYIKRPIDPYFLGLLIGDGHLGDAINITSADDPIAYYVKRLAGDNFCQSQKKNNSAVEIRFNGKFKSDLAQDLQDLGLLHRNSHWKFIPRQYLFASVDERWALFQGLMDSDGWAEPKKGIYYCTVSKRLANDVADLARSLGAMVSITTKVPSYTHLGEKKRGKKAYTLRIKLADPTQAFRLIRKRKVARTAKHQSLAKIISSVEFVKKTEGRCIQVRHSNSLYITDGYTVTHNTFALLLEPLRHVDNPRFTGVIFRQSYPQIFNPGALWDTSSELYPIAKGSPQKSDARWNFSPGSYIVFRHFQDDRAVADWQGSQTPYQGWDELTHFSAQQFFTVALSRGRSLSGVKPYVRCTCNPDAKSWVKDFLSPWLDSHYSSTYTYNNVKYKFGPAKPGELRYFIRVNGEIKWVPPDYRDEDGSRGVSVTFIPASVYDNRILLRKNPEYLQGLKSLPLVEQARLLYGDWNISEQGNMFRPDWFIPTSLDDIPRNLKLIRRWDLAASQKSKLKKEPDYTSSILLGLDDSSPIPKYYLLDMTLDQESPGTVAEIFKKITRRDKKFWRKYSTSYMVTMEQEPGSGGLNVIYDYEKIAAKLNIRFEGKKSTGAMGSKQDRAKPFSRECQAGNVYILTAEWNEHWFAFSSPFPDKRVKDDPVDAASGAYADFNEMIDGACPVDPVDRYQSIGSTRFSTYDDIISADYDIAHKRTRVDYKRFLKDQERRDRNIFSEIAFEHKHEGYAHASRR